MKKIFASLASFFAPVLAFAYTPIPTPGGTGLAQNTNFNRSYLDGVTGFIKALIGWVIPIIISILVIVFLWEVFRFIKAPPEDKTKRRAGLLYSILALFVAISIFGIISILQGITGTRGVNTLNSSSIPTVQW